jgi:hypothetical protein
MGSILNFHNMKPLFVNLFANSKCGPMTIELFKSFMVDLVTYSKNAIKVQQKFNKFQMKL